jgi:hypothetical protein
MVSGLRLFEALPSFIGFSLFLLESLSKKE